MKKINVNIQVLKQAEFTVEIPDDVFAKGEKSIREYLDYRIDNELDYADVTEKFNYFED